MRREPNAALHQAAHNFREQYGHLWEIVDVSPAERFSAEVICVDCTSIGARDALHSKVPQTFEGFTVHFTAPLWGVGGLSLDAPDTKLWLSRIATPPHNMHGTPENAANTILEKKLSARDEALWAAMSVEQQRRVVVGVIRKRRRYAPGYGNCGEKFLG
jgi:hypothetical protein